MGARVARALGYRFVDTGMMYRAFAWLALDGGVDPEDEEGLARLAKDVSMTLEPGPPEAPEMSRVSVNGTALTRDQLRSTEAGGALSLTSRVAAVREAMVEQQRRLAQEGGLVMAGRDIGTVVLPDAPVKIYLDASPEKRRRRRYDELVAAGRQITEAQVRDELAQRDEIDSARSVSPLRPADDAVVLDTDHLSLDEVVERILSLVPCRS